MQISMNIVKNLLDPNYPDHLPFVEKAQEIFELIKDLQKMKGWAFAKLKWLAQRLNVSKRYVQKILKVLRDAKLIEVKRREKNYYRVNPLLTESRTTEHNSASNKKATKQVSRQQIDQQAQAKLELSEAEAAAILTAYQVPQTIEAAVSPVSEPAVELMAIDAEPFVDPEIKEAVEEAAKEVRKESRNGRFKSAGEYFSKIKERLVRWQIEAPGFLIKDVVMKFRDCW